MTVFKTTRLFFFALLALPSHVFANEALPPGSEVIPNFRKVTDGLYRGGSPGVKGVLYLKKLGVKTILNLEARGSVIKKEKDAASAAGIKFISNPITLFTIPGTRKTTKLLEIMAKPENQPVFVHCRAGRDRTGLFVGLFRVEHQGWQPGHAFQEMLDLGYRTFYFPLNWIFERRTGFDI